MCVVSHTHTDYIVACLANCSPSQQIGVSHFREWDEPAVLLALTAFVGGFEARGAHRHVAGRQTS